jgi:TPR repeat protein
MSMRLVLKALAVMAIVVLWAAPARAEADVEKLIAKAKLGSVDAQLELGQAYRTGYAVMSDGSKIEKNLDEAERWLKEAANKNIRAKAWLGGLYSSSDFSRRDDSTAAHLFIDVARSKEADKQLVRSVQYSIGRILYQECTGYLISLDCGHNESSPFKNDQAAAYWFGLAAAQGHREAQFELATMYENGRGIPQDYSEAARLYESAALAGHEEADIMLGQLYDRMGRLPLAYMWFNMGVSENRHLADEKRDQLAKRMTPAELEEGQRLTREYRASHSTKTRDCSWGRC